MMGDYGALCADLGRLYEGKLGAGSARNRVVVETYWEIGRRIVEAEGLLGLEPGGRGRQGLVPRLSADLGARYGEGFGRTNLFAMKKFFLLYGEDEVEDPLLWSCYRILVNVRDGAWRQELGRLARDGLSSRELAGLASRPWAGEGGTGAGAVGAGQPGRPGRFGLLVEGGGEAVLDLGFWIRLSPPLPLAPGLLAGCARGSSMVVELRDGMVVAAAGSGADAAERYWYGGSVERVIDGDTVLLDVRIGEGVVPGLVLRQRCRLAGLDAVELDSLEGGAARDQLAGLLPAGAEVVVRTRKSDVYGRYVVDVFAGVGGVHVNSALVDGSCGRVMARSWQ